MSGRNRGLKVFFNFVGDIFIKIPGECGENRRPKHTPVNFFFFYLDGPLMANSFEASSSLERGKTKLEFVGSDNVCKSLPFRLVSLQVAVEEYTFRRLVS